MVWRARSSAVMGIAGKEDYSAGGPSRLGVKECGDGCVSRWLREGERGKAFPQGPFEAQDRLKPTTGRARCRSPSFVGIN
jgi:hypothetical protein